MLNSPFQSTFKTIDSPLGPLTLYESTSKSEKRYYKEIHSNLTNSESRIQQSPFLLKIEKTPKKNGFFIEFFEKTLYEDISQRFSTNSCFMEFEVLKMVENVIKGLISLRNNGFSHGGVIPKAIFLVENGYKLMDMGFFLGENWLLKQAFYEEIESRPYLSPKLLDFIKESRGFPIEIREKDEVFALGITIFGVLSMKNINEFYDNRYFVMNYDKIDEEIKGFQEKYSREITEIMRKMIEKNEEKRCDFAEIIEVFRKIQENSEKMFIYAGSLLRNSESVKKSNENAAFLKKSAENLGFSGEKREKSPKFFNNNSSNFEFSLYKTPEKAIFHDKIHRVTPGSLGKSSIKIMYTPNRKTEEKNRILDEEFARNLQRIESQKKNADRSIGFLRETIEFLKEYH